MGDRIVLAESDLIHTSNQQANPSGSSTSRVSGKISAIMEASESADDMASSILLADVTSLMLLSAAADKFTKSGKDKLQTLFFFFFFFLSFPFPFSFVCLFLVIL